MDYDKINDLLRDPKKIVITTHTNPDGDAMGSSLGLYHYLKKIGHEVQVITPTNYPKFLHWLPGNKEVLVYNWNEGASRKAERLVDAADILFSLDYNDLKRIDALGERVAKARGVKIMIDHHPDPDDFADHMLSDTTASSTCALIYMFMQGMGNADMLDKDMGDCLYTGIVTDTGSFRFASATARTHRIAAAMMEAGADHVHIHERIFDTFSENRMRLFGYSLKEKLVVMPEAQAAYIALSKEELLTYEHKNGDTEGLVNYALSVEGIVYGALFMEMEGIVKISFRSKGEFSVNEMARDHFNGGGHRNAAGGASFVSLDETVKKFVEVIPQYHADQAG